MGKKKETETKEAENKGPSLGEIAWEAYREATSGVSLVDRKPLPNWGKLQAQSPVIAEAWEAVGQAVAKAK